MSRILTQTPSTTRVYLNKVGLTDIDPTIYIRSVKYGAPSITTKTVERARYNGSRVTRQRMDSSTVTVSFSVIEYDPARYMDIMHRITAWAMAGGVLTTDDRPNQRLRVVCTSAPSGQGQANMADAREIEFSAFDQPFWEDTIPKRTTLTGSTGNGQISGVGSASDPFVEVRAVTSGTVTSITLNAANTTISLSGISVQTGQALVIAYDETHTLHIYNEDTGVSYLSKRSAASDDDLMIPAGEFSAVSFTANGSMTVTFSVRGLYL